ncbi:MAG: UMP kinase [Candidatus Sumerlaeia bacterium]|nr:UMP kinase [Candidatus Sumerlaeia bacterium]
MPPSDPAPSPVAYRRVLLKLSGEAFKGSMPWGIDRAIVDSFADEIVEVKRLGVEVALVIGGGNIFRGDSQAAEGMNRAAADNIGMLATVINALVFQNVLEHRGLATRVLSAVEMPTICEPFIRRRALRHLEKGRVVIFAGGTGNPYFTTDTAAALRGMEIEADIVLKATKVDGVYSADPVKDASALLHRHLTFDEVIQGNLRVMDTSAVSLCRDHGIPIGVFNLTVPGNVARIVRGEAVGTLVTRGEL